MVFYTDHVQNVHLLSITPTSLSDSNLTGSASSCSPATAVPVTGANTGLSSSFANIATNVVYQSPTIRESGKFATQFNPIHLLSGSLAWVDQTLDTAGSGLFAAAQNGLSSLTDANGGQHVFYVNGNGHVCQQTAPPYTAGCVPWTSLDVTSATPPQGAQTWTANAGANHGAIASFDDASGAYHIVAVGSDGYVFLLSYDPVSKAWSGTPFEGTAEEVAPGSGLSGFVDANGIYVFYIAKDNSVHHLLNANPGTAGSWVDTNLTRSATEDPSGNPVPNAAQASSLSSFSDKFGEHAVYIGADRHVHQFSHSLDWADSQWTDQDLTLLATAFLGSTKPPAAQSSALSSFANPNTSNSNVEWIFYIGNDQHVHLLTFAPQPQWPPSGGGGNGPLQAPQCPAGKTGEVGTPYNVTLIGSGGQPPYQFNAAPLPPGLTVVGNQITGTPTQAGSFTYTLTLTDASRSTSKPVSCSIQIIGPLIQPSCPNPATAVVGQPYTSTEPAVGGTPPYTFTLANTNNIPPGLTFTSTETTFTIAGTPTTEGDYQVSVKVTDSAGATVLAGPCPITVTGSFQVTAQLFLESNYYQPPSRPGMPGGPPSFSWVLDGPASGLTFVKTSGGTPVNSTESPVGSGNYTISGVMSGTELSLGPSNYTLCTATPGPTPSPVRSWSFKVAAGTTKIYVYPPLIVNG